jgi:anti-anti-sigma regulatory factor
VEETSRDPGLSLPGAEGALRALPAGVMDISIGPVLLPVCFDATSVRAVYQALREAMKQPGDLHVDGRQVATVDTAGGQLLAAAALTGRHLHLEASVALQAFLDATALSVVLS